MTIAIDRSPPIRASLQDTELTLLAAIGLISVVVFFFLGNVRATIVPLVAVPVSILGTFGAMYLLGYSLDILSLMALTIATGFVVDDAIVVLENISRHLEAGMPRLQAASLGAREVGFTVLSISLSLIAVFLPILLMGGILGRLFREFTVTLSLAVTISLVVSLTTIPMMCAFFLRGAPAPRAERRSGPFGRLRDGYARSLIWTLGHGRLVLLMFFGTIGLNIVLFTIVPKAFFPEEDTGRMFGILRGRSEHLLSGHGFKAARNDGHRPARPSRGKCSWFHRREQWIWRIGQFKFRDRVAKAFVAASANRAGDRATAAEARPSPRR